MSKLLNIGDAFVDPEEVAAVKATKVGSYDAYCTIYLKSGEKFRIKGNASRVRQKIENGLLEE